VIASRSGVRYLALAAFAALAVQAADAATTKPAATAKPGAAAAKPPAAAAEVWEGYWAKNRKDCRYNDGPDSKTMIYLKNKENGRPAPLYDQYENHCRIDSHATRANVTTLKLTCYEFWEYYKAKKEPRRDTITVTQKDRDRIIMNGSSYIRCRK